ncbi:MAG: flagellar hook-basal body complex protein FliE [Dethiobacter sp.]|jgi:flagellar hook-basal body complex protein FliE|nr:MAG: flagellar hook-basal body complex protein FliE [Dethiobacter sp.]
MKINPVTMLIPQGSRVGEIKAKDASPRDFTDVLFKALKEVNQLQLKADEVTEKMVLGELDDVHQVMLMTEKAKLALQLTVQIRNKLVEAYQEVSRMQF